MSYDENKVNMINHIDKVKLRYYNIYYNIKNKLLSLKPFLKCPRKSIQLMQMGQSSTSSLKYNKMYMQMRN